MVIRWCTMLAMVSLGCSASRSDVPAICADQNDYAYARFVLPDGRRGETCEKVGHQGFVRYFAYQTALERCVAGGLTAFGLRPASGRGFGGWLNLNAGYASDGRTLMPGSISLAVDPTSGLCLPDAEDCTFVDTDELGRNPRCRWDVQREAVRVGDVYDIRSAGTCILTRAGTTTAPMAQPITLEEFRAYAPWIETQTYEYRMPDITYDDDRCTRGLGLDAGR